MGKNFAPPRDRFAPFFAAAKLLRDLLAGSADRSSLTFGKTFMPCSTGI